MCYFVQHFVPNLQTGGEIVGVRNPTGNYFLTANENQPESAWKHSAAFISHCRSRGRGDGRSRVSQLGDPECKLTWTFFCSTFESQLGIHRSGSKAIRIVSSRFLLFGNLAVGNSSLESLISWWSKDSNLEVDSLILFCKYVWLNNSCIGHKLMVYIYIYHYASWKVGVVIIFTVCSPFSVFKLGLRLK